MSKHTDAVMGMYAAFGRGDVDHIVAQMSDDVRWDHGIRETDLAYLQPRTGKDQVPGFFADLMERVEFTVFEPGPPCEGGDTVMVPVREVARNLQTGREIPDDVSVHIWTFGPDGKVTAFRHVFDIASHERAAQPVGATATAS